MSQFYDTIKSKIVQIGEGKTLYYIPINAPCLDTVNFANLI
jgi:hypothetical protein